MPVCYRIAYEFMTKWGYRYFLSNGRSVWNDDLDTAVLDGNGMLKAFILIDEAGQFLHTSRDVNVFLAFQAKLDNVIVMPSYRPPSISVRSLVLQPVFKFTKLGIPAWMYKWSLRDGDVNEKGSFIWWKPSEIYGIYSRQDPAVDDGGLSEYLDKKIEEIVTRSGRKYSGQYRQVLDMASIGGQADNEEIQEQLESVTERIDRATNLISVSRRGAK